MRPKSGIWVVIPNLNAADLIAECLYSLAAQTQRHRVVVVDNGSVDKSPELISKKFPNVTLLKQKVNLGFAGGVNVGIRFALEHGAEAIALLNNDAVADKNWLKNLVGGVTNNDVGIVTSKILHSNDKLIDTAGLCYSIWGLPYARGRDEADENQYGQEEFVFGGSGGASLYSAEMLGQIGLFDEDFFAYYEDDDVSFRAQLAGWRVVYTPKAVVHHKVNATSSKMGKGFVTYHALKNLPWLLVKNVPLALLLPIATRFMLAYGGFLWSAVSRGDGTKAFRALGRCLQLLPKKIWQRRQIQKRRGVPVDYIRSLMTRDLPPSAKRLRSLRGFFVRSRH